MWSLNCIYPPKDRTTFFVTVLTLSQSNRMFNITTQNASHTLTLTTYFHCLEDKDEVKKR